MPKYIGINSELHKLFKFKPFSKSHSSLQMQYQLSHCFDVYFNCKFVCEKNNIFRATLTHTHTETPPAAAASVAVQCVD